MFGFDLGELKQQVQSVFDAQVRLWAGAAFMAAALAAIQYDEIIAPELSRVSDAWTNAAGDFSRRLTSFTL